MTITVRDFVNLLCEISEVKLYSTDTANVIYDGLSVEIPLEMLKLEIQSIDGIWGSTDCFTLNV